jgi:hypothetical protein
MIEFNRVQSDSIGVNQTYSMQLQVAYTWCQYIIFLSKKLLKSNRSCVHCVTGGLGDSVQDTLWQLDSYLQTINKGTGDGGTFSLVVRTPQTKQSCVIRACPIHYRVSIVVELRI